MTVIRNEAGTVPGIVVENVAANDAGSVFDASVRATTPSTRTTRRGFRLPSSTVAAVIAFVVLLSAYLATAAPDLTFWDASELATAANTMGIPHPPGTPLWVLIARVAAMVFSSAGPARSVTMLSAWATAAAGALGAAMATRWIGARGAVAAAVSAGAMMSVWANATETEVYAVSLLLSVAMLYAGERAGRHDASDDTRQRWRALLAFLTALTLPIHLSAMVALPAAIAFAWRGARPTTREMLTWCALAALALSACAVLPLRAGHAPALNSGNAVTLRAVVSVLQREQYAVAGLWPRSAPLWLQFGNVFEWADWQVAFGLHRVPSPSWSRTPLTLLWGWLALLGVRGLWRHDARVGRAMALLLLCGTLGVATWLNLKAGPTYGSGVLADSVVREARERDYFFVLGFWAWGLSAGAGLAVIAARLATRLPAVIAPVAYAVAAVPLVANGPAMDRTREPMASLPRTFGRLLLDAVPQNGVLFTAGDNDSFPLWYLQQVEDYRSDVTVVTIPLLRAAWYREQIATRTRLLPASSGAAVSQLEALQTIATSAAANRRSVRVSALLSAMDRNRVSARVGWALQGLVYAPDSLLRPGTMGLDMPALARARDHVPPALLMTLPVEADAAAFQMQALLRCTQVVAPADPLLVSACGGT